MTARVFPRMVLSLWLALSMPSALAIGVGNVLGGINTVTISAATVAAIPLCAQWMPIGACTWLYCGWSGCRIRVSVKVRHYNPDLVVSVYNELGGNPWTEVAATLGTAQQTAASALLTSLLGVTVDSAGNRTEGTREGNRRDHRNMIFREADVVGHPTASLIGLMQNTGLICPPATNSFFPIFRLRSTRFPGEPRSRKPCIRHRSSPD